MAWNRGRLIFRTGLGTVLRKFGYQTTSLPLRGMEWQGKTLESGGGGECVQNSGRGNLEWGDFAAACQLRLDKRGTKYPNGDTTNQDPGPLSQAWHCYRRVRYQRGCTRNAPLGPSRFRGALATPLGPKTATVAACPHATATHGTAFRRPILRHPQSSPPPPV